MADHADRNGHRDQVLQSSICFRPGIGRPSIWEALRHQVFLGSEAFAERHCVSSKPLERLREVHRAQRRPLVRPVADATHCNADRREAMARASGAGCPPLATSTCRWPRRLCP